MKLTLACMGAVGALIAGLGLSAAYTIIRQALGELRELLGESDRGTLATLRGLVDVMIRRKKFAETEPLAIECYELHAAAYGDTNTNTVRAIELLIDLYEGWGNEDRASQWRDRLPALVLVAEGRP